MAYLGKTPSQAVRSRYYYTATGGETSLSGADDNSNVLTFTDGNYVDVSLNGVALVAGTDYNTTTTNTIGGLTALVASDVVEVIVYDTFSVFSGNVTGDFTVGGTLTAANITNTGDLTFGDNDKAIFGTGSDLQIYHDGLNSYVLDNGTGNLNLRGTSLRLSDASGTHYLVANSGAEVSLTHSGANKLATTATGIDVTGVITTDGLTTSADITFGDNDKAIFGAGSDLQIFHDSSHSYIQDTSTGDLRLTSNGSGVMITKTTTENMARFLTDGAVELYYDGGTYTTPKLATTSTGVDVTGTVTAQAPTATDGLITVKGASGDFSGGIALVADAGENATDWFRIASIQSGGSHDLRVSTSSDTTPTWDTHFLNINSGGDISFYEDTGSTVKFFWDSSNEGIALGNNQLSGDWGHYFPVIEVGGRGAFWSDSTGWSGTPRTHFSNNVSRNDAGTLKYIESDPASVIDLDADVFKFSNAAAGSAGSTLTLTERLRIDSSGNVGIGTSSPSEELTISRSDDARISITSSSTSKASMIGLIEFDGSDGRNSYIGVVSGNMTINTDGGYPIKFQTTGTERMRIDSGGNVGIGTSSPAATSSTYKNLQVALGATVIGRTDDTPLYLSSNLSYDSGWKYIANTTATQIVLSTNMQFFNAPSGTAGTAATLTERMRIASNGDILFGCTSAPSASVVGSGFIKSAYDSELFMSGSLTTGNDLIHFFNPNGKVGSIATNGTSTAYNTSSDYRLKENVVADWDATTRLKQLNPVRFNFIANPDTTVDGFLAHEVQSVVPEAISGTHNEVDDEGNPVYQGIDQSKLVPLLVKTIQELEARITALETA